MILLNLHTLASPDLPAHPFDLSLISSGTQELVPSRHFQVARSDISAAIDTFGTVGSAGTFGGCFGCFGTAACCC